LQRRKSISEHTSSSLKRNIFVHPCFTVGRALMRLFSIIAFICLQLTLIVESIPITRPIVWHRDFVRIYNCDSNQELHVLQQRIRNNSLVRAERTNVIHGWVEFLNSQQPYNRMYGIEKDGQWYFMQLVNGRIRLVEDDPPTGFVPVTDGRYFSYRRRIHDGNLVLTHLASETVVVLNRSFLTTSNDEALAANICMQSIAILFNSSLT